MSSRGSDLLGCSPLSATAEVAGEGWGGWEEGASPEDHFDRLPDSVLLLVFNKIGDVKALGRCCVVSRRFHALVPLVDDVLVRVDCVISSDEDHIPSPNTNTPSSSSFDVSSSPASSSSCSIDKPRGGLFSQVARLVLGGLIRPLQAITHILAIPSAGGAGSDSSTYGKRDGSSPSSTDADMAASSEVSHHSPSEVLRNFKEIRRLRIELPSGELGVDDGVLLKWKAHFGSTLNSCVILGASSVLPTSTAAAAAATAALSSPATDKGAETENTGGEVGEGFCRDGPGGGGGVGGEDNGNIPESFYTNGSLKLRVVWTISSLIAASARHYLLQPIIGDHDTLESLDLTDADGQGVLQMDRGQLEELRVKPVSASGFSQRTPVPALNMRLWYAHHLELPGGVVLKGATLVAVRPSEASRELSELGTGGGGGQDAGWVSSAFEEPYASAVRQLGKRRMYCLEMNSF